MNINNTVVLAALQKELAARGFELDLKNERFAKATDFGAFYFQLVFTDKAGALLVSPGAYIRFNAVENISTRVSELSEGEAAHSFTIGVDLWRFFNDKSLRFVGTKGEDISHLVTSIVCSFDKYANPYFTEFGSLEKVDSLLNDNPGVPCPHRLLPWLRAVTGLVVAKVMERKDFPQLQEFYSEQVRSISNGFYWLRFEKLLTLLRGK